MDRDKWIETSLEDLYVDIRDWADRVYCIMGADLKIVNVQSLLVIGALKL